MRSRSPLKFGARHSALLRGCAGAAIVACAIAVVAVLAPVVSRWLDGPTRPTTPEAIAAIPDDTGPTIRSEATATATTHKHRAHAKAKADPRHRVLVGGDVVVLNGTGAAPAAKPATPAPAPAAPAKRPASRAPHQAPADVTEESKPGAPAVVTAPAPPAAAAAASSGLVRLSVQSVGIGPSASGDPELQAKLAIEGAQPSDALPPTVTLHLRPQMPSTAQSNPSALALRTTVDMVDAPRTTPNDPALRMRVRMAITAAAAGTATAVPVVQDPGPADGKSNVIAMTVGLQSFVRAPQDGTPGEGDPTTPPDNQGPGGDPTTPPDNQGPSGDPTTPPDNQGPSGDPTTPPDGQDPGADPTTPPAPPTGGDPTTPPTPPAGGEPTTPPVPPTGGGPATTPQPTAGNPTTLPPTEIIIPVGPVRPNEGTTTVPVPADPTATDPGTDQLPIVVIVEELPPDEPPVDPGTQPTPAAQDPAPEVVPPPADTTDPGTAPAPDPGAGDVTAIVVSADAPPPAANNS